MPFLTDKEKAQLRDAIAHAESRTQAEIVTVIAKQSDGYRFIPLLWAALIALSLPGVVYAFQAISTGGWLASNNSSIANDWIYPLQVLTFLGIGMVLQIPAARLWIIPKRVKHQRAARHAKEQFFLQNLHQTQGRTGVLVFVSIAEHYVEIIVDKAISEAIDDALWQQTIDEFIEHVQRGDIYQGFEGTIAQCQALLWEHFPANDGKPDELTNHLIEV